LFIGSLLCVGNTCVYPTKLSLPGDECSLVSDCIGASTCSGTVCVGVALGATCASSEECVFGAYCSSSTKLCTALLATGANCAGLGYPLSGSSDNTACPLMNDCGGNGKCSVLFSGSTLTDQCVEDASCSFGFFCKFAGGSVGTCSPAPNTPFPCNSSNGNNDCTQYGSTSECVCDTLSGNTFCNNNLAYAYPPCTASLFTQAGACADQYQCKIGPTTLGDSRSCFRKKCPKYANCLLECTVTNSPANTEAQNDNCISYPATWTCPGSSDSQKFIVSLVFVFVCAFFSVFSS